MTTETGKVAIVTGAGHGIGAATVGRLSREGWRVAAADIDGAAADAVAHATGGIGIACDVGAEADIRRLIDAVLGAYGRIDAIVSNAGINARGPLHSLTLETWNRVLAVNLTAAFLLARAAEQPLRSARGAMVLIASTRAHMPSGHSPRACRSPARCPIRRARAGSSG